MLVDGFTASAGVFTVLILVETLEEITLFRSPKPLTVKGSLMASISIHGQPTGSTPDLATQSAFNLQPSEASKEHHTLGIGTFL